MYDRYIFYQASANKKELVVWSSFYAHEDYMKRNNILQTKEGTKWDAIISMGYLSLDLDKKQLHILPLINRDVSHISQYLQQIHRYLEKNYPDNPKMREVVQDGMSAIADTYRRSKQKYHQEGR